MIQLYNTLTRKKEKFVPQMPGKVSMYVCGPTVYNYIHIGNARSTVAFDTIRRYLEYRGFEVTYISNFTDVDDKIIKAAKERGETPEAVADYFIKAYFEDVEALGVKRATVHPRVMDNIPEIIDFVSRLIEKGYAYEVDGNVYYKTEAFEDYGKLSHLDKEQLKLGASNRLDEAEFAKKDSPVDFALWKKAKPGEISWESPWGAGRPGWHIECSVMSTKYLGDTMDIHAGGQDLTFPHHENEIAQSEAKTGHPFAHYWLHNGFVTMGDEKMSKSLGNFKLVRDLRQTIDPQAIRFFLATAHYRHPLSFSEAAIHEAKSQLDRIKTALANAHHRLGQLEADDELDEMFAKRWQAYEEQFQNAMDDDFQAQNAISVVYEMVGDLNRYLEKTQISATTLQFMIDKLTELFAIFGIVDLYEVPELLDAEIEALIAERENARAAKDYARADEIRDQLAQEGIQLEDTANGVRYRRVGDTDA